MSLSAATFQLGCPQESVPAGLRLRGTRDAPCPGTVRVGSQVPNCIQTIHCPFHLDHYPVSSLQALTPLRTAVSSE